MNNEWRPPVRVSPPPRSLQKTVAARHLSNCGKAAELSEPEAGVVAYSLFQIFS